MGSDSWLQTELRRICANVLQLDVQDVDPKRSFLSLGGDSLLAIKILAQCRAQGITINIADIMAAATIEALYGAAQGPPETEASDSSNESTTGESGTLTPTTDTGLTVSDNISPAIEAKLSALSASRDQLIQAIVPCSAIQDRMLISQLQNPHLYSCSFVLKFTHSHRGLPVVAKRIGQAWGEVVKRHSSLRTALVESTQRPGHYNQVILSEITPCISYYQGSKQVSSPEFDLKRPVTFETHSIPHRVQLVQTSPSEVYMKLDVSHLLVDGQSAEVLLKDLSDAYRDGELSAAPLSYSDYVSSYLLEPSQPTAQPEDNSVEISPLTVPMDRPNEGLFDFETIRTDVHLDSRAVQSVCAQFSVTLATVCQLAWGLVLRCYGGSDSVCFSYVNSGRSMSIPGVHDVIGPIVQTALCSIQMNGADELSHVLSRIHKDAVKALSQVSPLESTNSTSKSARQLSNTTMSFQRSLDDMAAQKAGLAVTIKGKANPTDYDISLGISACPDGLSIDLDFWKSRLDSNSAKTILGAFEAAIRGIFDTPHAKVSDIGLLSSSDVSQLAEWNSSIPKADRVCIHDKILEISKLQPNAAAVNAFDGDLTYLELTSQASTLAHHLREQFGVGPERFVGICMDKSKWSIVAMLAVLMAGGIVVPLGVSHPRARVKGLLTDTAAVALLVDAKHAERLADLELESTSTLTVDEQLIASLPSMPDPPVSGATADNAAWVIYTSGSTGVPKGVVLLHQNISTSVLAHGGMFGVNCNTRTAQFAAFTFDVSLSDIVMTLFHGGCVCVFSEESRMNNLTEVLQGLAVNYVNLTPTVLGLLDPADLPLIDTVVAGGEAMDPGIVKKWSPHARVFNSVGPSECTIIAVAAGPVTDPNEAANVGHPTGTRLWVTLPTDPNQLCPIGVPGELLIEGPMLSRGYLNDAEKTAAAFIENPTFINNLESHNAAWKVQFQGRSRRMYRSGDLVRQNQDGSLVHMGRRDTQVKIRGQRVEIGEIEYWIMQRLTDVRRVAVLVVERGQGKEQKSLVAAIEFKEENEFFTHGDDVYPADNAQDPSASPQLLPLTESLSGALHQLRTDLMEHLPPYMSPTMYAPVSQLPLNLSGKIDRRAVTRFVNDQDDAQLQQYLAVNGSHKEPATETESKLQQLWAKTLGVAPCQVSADGHFFHIGGDSVAAMRVVAAAREFELVLRVADLFEYPRLNELARAVESRVAEDDDEEDPAPFTVWRASSGMSSTEESEKLDKISGLCNLPTDQIEDVLPCTALQEGLIALTAQQPTAYIDRQAFSLADNIDLDRFRAAWKTVVDRNSNLRTRIVSGPETGSLQVVLVPGEIEWRESFSLDHYLNADRKLGMAIGEPLNRFALVTQPDGQRFFVWTAHHSTYDGWARGLILQQVADAYLDKELSPSVSFSRFISYVERSQAEETAIYWQRQLAGETNTEFPVSPSPNYRPRPQQRHRHAIALARSTGSSFMIPDLLRGAWALVVHQHIGRLDPVFAVALSGRNAPVRNVTSITGPTLTTVPVRIQIDSEQSVQEFLQAVRQQSVEMIAHEHTGLQKIRKMVPDLASALDLKHLFVVQPASDDETPFNIPGVEQYPVAIEEFDSYGLNVECTLSGQSVEVDVRFDENMVPSAQVARLMSQFESVVQQLQTQAEGTKIKDIDLLGVEDINKITDWNVDALPQPLSACLHDVLADVVRSQSEATAIEAWDGSLTYEQLHSQASKLASHLVSLGVGPEIAVPVCMDKSVWAIVSFLAILQAGGVVVPLGVGHPLSRLETIINDTKAKIILVDSTQAARLAGLSSQGLNLLTVNASLLDSLSPASAVPSVKPENAAWIVFTSGSTGQPKGVVLTHSNLSTAVKTHGARFGLGQHTRTIQFAAHTFDAVLQDYFTTLVSGGTVCVPSEEDRMSNLAGAMRTMNVNFANVTSTVARLLTPESVPSLRLLVLAGEQIQDAVVETWYKHADVLNVYGPTECSINSTCNGPITDLADAQSIGFDMGCRSWIADPSNPNRLVPVGTPGELLIEGAGLAREYLGDRQKTDGAFIADPAFAARFGVTKCRVYRTGDLAKQNENGKILYLGRIDTQIKIRGQRVEIGEIEHWVGQGLSNVKHVAVVPVPRGDKQLRLAAVIEFQDGHNVESETFAQLKKTLSSQMPAYMVPSLYIPVNQTPLTVSGKLDRRAIRQMVEDMPSAELDQHYAGESREQRVAPSSDTEKALQRLWASALGVEVDTIGADDDFFQLGGDSVVAMHIAASSRQNEILKGLSVADIFLHPRLSALATLLEGRGEGEDEIVEEQDESPFALLQEALDFDSF